MAVGKDAFSRIVKTNGCSCLGVGDIPIAHRIEEYDSEFHYGVSVYLEGPFCTEVEYLEVPYSIVDRRFDWWHCNIIARSIFCKGKALRYFSPRDCLDFVLMNPRIDKVILGVDSVDQLKANVWHLVKMEKFTCDEEVDTRKF